jgi:hypothetical protein
MTPSFRHWLIAQRVQEQSEIVTLFISLIHGASQPEGYEYAQERGVPPTIEGIVETIENKHEVQGLEAYYFRGRRATPNEVVAAIQHKTRLHAAPAPVFPAALNHA